MGAVDRENEFVLSIEPYRFRAGHYDICKDTANHAETLRGSEFEALGRGEVPHHRARLRQKAGIGASKPGQ